MTESTVIREIMHQYDKHRAEWIRRWGDDSGFDDWFREQCGFAFKPDYTIGDKVICTDPNDEEIYRVVGKVKGVAGAYWIEPDEPDPTSPIDWPVSIHETLLANAPDGEAWCPICEEHMLTYDDKCVECGARTKPIGAK